MKSQTGLTIRNYPSLGNGTYYNGWLRAADISPEQYVNELLGKILKVGKNGMVEPKLTFQHIGKSVTFHIQTGYRLQGQGRQGQRQVCRRSQDLYH